MNVNDLNRTLARLKSARSYQNTIIDKMEFFYKDGIKKARTSRTLLDNAIKSLQKELDALETSSKEKGG